MNSASLSVRPLPRAVRKTRTLVSSAVAVFMTALLTACGHGFQLRNYPNPVTLYVAGMEQFHRGNWDNAVTALDQVTVLLGPRDTLLPRAHFYLAQAHGKTRHRLLCEVLSVGCPSNLLAASSYKRLFDGFPDDTLADDALLGMADSYAKVWRGPGFDKTYAVQALEAYDAFERVFPSSPLLAIAKAGEARMNEGLGRADFETGMYFFRRSHAYDSALIYFKDVVALYPGTTAARDAMLMQIEIYKRLHYVADAADACRSLRTESPKSPDVLKACAGVATDTAD